MSDKAFDPTWLCVYTASLRMRLSNTVKNPRASRGLLHLELDKSNKYLVVTVTDDGVGLNLQKQSGLGLIGIRERIALFNGKVRIFRRPTGDVPSTKFKFHLRLIQQIEFY